MLSEPVRGTIPERAVFSLSGLEQLRAYVQGRLPSTPHSRLLGYRPTQAGSGSAVLVQPIGPWFEIYDGYVDLTTTAELSVYMAAMTAAPPATMLRTVTLSLRYLRPCTVEDASVVARSRVLHAGSKFTTVETLIEDTLGRAVAHATGCVLTTAMDPPPPQLSHPLLDQVEEPVYATPDPPRRRLPASTEPGVGPMAGLLGLDVVELSDERAVTTMVSSEWFCLTSHELEAGIVATHGTLTASLLNARILGDGQRSATFETSTSFLAPVKPDGRALTATAEVAARHDEVFVLDLEMADADGQVVVVGRGTLLARERRRRQSSQPSNRLLLTVLFTDVVGSTERISEVGDARWLELLDEHHEVVRRHFGTHEGREVNTTGDGFVATFDSPSRALACAIDIRVAVARLGIEIRAGIHTGECEVVGRDVAGLAVHVASRVQSAAEPGEILVSNTVRDLVSGSPVKLIDRGERQLKGLDGDWRLWAAEQ